MSVKVVFGGDLTSLLRENVYSTNHPGLTEMNAPVGSKEVMSLGRGFPLKTINQSTVANCGCGQ